MKVTEHCGPRSFTYSIPSIATKSKNLRNSGLRILQNFQKCDEVQTRNSQTDALTQKSRCDSLSQNSSFSKPTNHKSMPYYHAQNLNSGSPYLSFSRKTSELNLLDLPLIELRSYTDNLLLTNL